MNKNIVNVILILVFIAILFLLDFPAYNEVAFLRGETNKHQDILSEKEELLIKVEQLKQVYDSHKTELDKVYYLLPLEKNIPELIVQLEALASENGLVLDKLDFSEAPKSLIKSLKVVLGLTGSYSSFESFLEALELNVRLMDIKSISFSPEQEGESIFTFDIELIVYYQ